MSPARRGPLRLLGEAERIETGWWDGGDIARDYYTAADLHGVRLWIFVREPRRTGGSSTECSGEHERVCKGEGRRPAPNAGHPGLARSMDCTAQAGRVSAPGTVLWIGSSGFPRALGWGRGVARGFLHCAGVGAMERTAVGVG